MGISALPDWFLHGINIDNVLHFFMLLSNVY